MSAPETAVQPHWKRNVTLFLTGQLFSMFGSMLVLYVIMWHLTLETKSGFVMTLVVLIGMLPEAIVSIFGGVWADRLNRKRLIILADGSIAVVTVLLAFVMLGGYQELWIILLISGIRSFFAGIQRPAASALIPQLVPPDQLLRVNGIFQGLMAGMMILAPAAAAGIYATWGLVPAFFIDAITAVIGIGFLLFIPVATVRTGEGSSYLGDLRDGLRYTFTHPIIRWALGVLAIVMLLGAAPSFLTPLMIARSFGEEVWMLTANEIAFSVGMLAGSGIIAAIAPRIRRLVLVVVAIAIVFGGINIGLGLSPNIWIFISFMLLCGLAIPIMQTPLTTLFQLKADPDYLGRVFGLVGVVMSVAMPLGMAVFGPFADVISIEALLVAAGVLTFIVMAVAVLLPSGRRAIREGVVPPPAAAPDEVTDPAASPTQ